MEVDGVELAFGQPPLHPGRLVLMRGALRIDESLDGVGGETGQDDREAGIDPLDRIVERALELAAQFFTTTDVRVDLVGRPRVLVALNPA